MKSIQDILHQVIYFLMKIGLLISESNDEIWRQIVHSIEADIRSHN